jgi:hypothetical protein
VLVEEVLQLLIGQAGHNQGELGVGSTAVVAKLTLYTTVQSCCAQSSQSQKCLQSKQALSQIHQYKRKPCH